MSRVNKKVGGIHSRVDTMYHWMQLDHLNWDLGGLNADNIDDIMDEGDDHNNDDDWLLIHIAHVFCIFFLLWTSFIFYLYEIWIWCLIFFMNLMFWMFEHLYCIMKNTIDVENLLGYA
jgi:hypothetical protein